MKGLSRKERKERKEEFLNRVERVEGGEVGVSTQRRRGAEVERGMVFNRVEHVDHVEMGRKQTTNRHKSTQI